MAMNQVFAMHRQCFVRVWLVVEMFRIEVKKTVPKKRMDNGVVSTISGLEDRLMAV